MDGWFMSSAMAHSKAVYVVSVAAANISCVIMGQQVRSLLEIYYLNFLM
jgi:hypothetical protein